MRETERKDQEEQLTVNELAIETKHRRLETIVRLVLVIVGAIFISIAVSAMLGYVVGPIVIDRYGQVMAFALGLATILTGLLKVNLIQFLF
jgi:hypothetical protein